MISTVQTLSLAQARKWWDDLRESGVLDEVEIGAHTLRSAWIGFDTCDADRSPLHDVSVGRCIIVRCLDWDVDNVNRSHGPAPELAPTIDHARGIVRFVLDLHHDAASHRLAVHCHAGLFRSGAVAEWVRSDLGVVEPPTSNRLVDVIGDTEEQRIYNVTLLRLLREAHAEMLR